MSINICEAKAIVAQECTAALDKISDAQSEAFIEAILAADKVFFVGVGRVLLSLQAICKRFAHLGIGAHYVGEITEPAITDKDLLIVGSGSGESLFERFYPVRQPDAAFYYNNSHAHIYNPYPNVFLPVPNSAFDIT